MRVGFIGLGRMGLPMCANLVRAGYDVTAGDLRPGRQDAVAACGARWGGTAVEVAAAADVLITVLPGTRELCDMMMPMPGGVLAALPRAATWIDMTSTAPVAGRVLAHAARAGGVGMLDAPAGGGVPAAISGTLQLFVGGDAELFERHCGLLQALADPHRIVHMGGHGAGYTTKLLVNLLWFGQAIATAEALLLAHREGIDLEVLHRALADSAAASSFIHHDLSALLGGDYLASFGLDRCTEELAAITDLARENGVPFQLSEHVEQTYRCALARYGPADGELLAVAMLEEQAGSQLRRRPA
jgi:3-hydroxyisobutyrate dehydrogenase